MPRESFSTDLKAALAAGTSRLSLALGIERADGERFGFTRHQGVTLGDFTHGTVSILGLAYVNDAAMIPTNFQQSVDIGKADNMEVKATLGDYVTESDCRKGLFNGASWWLFVYDRADSTDLGLLCRGRVGQAKVEGGQAVFSLRSLANQLQDEIGDVTGPLNRLTWAEMEANGYFDLGGNTADGHAARVTGAIDAVGSIRRVFTLSDIASQPSGRFVEGTVTWNSGDNDGHTAQIMDCVAGVITLWHPTPEDIAVGDSVTVTIKVPLTAGEWQDIVGDMRFFGAEPEIVTLERANQVSQV
jgi:hypothetical protein